MQRTWVWFLAPTRGFTNIDSSCFRGLCRSTESSYTYTQQDTHTHRIEINKSLQQRVFSWLLLSKANKIIIGYQPFLFISLVHICAHMWLHTEGRSQLPVLFSWAVHLVFWDRVSVVERTLLSQAGWPVSSRDPSICLRNARSQMHHWSSEVDRGVQPITPWCLGSLLFNYLFFLNVGCVCGTQIFMFEWQMLYQ